MVKTPSANAGDEGLIPGLGRSSGEGNGDPLQYSCLGNPTDRGTWRAAVQGVTKSCTWLTNSTHTHTHNEFRQKCISMKQTLSQVALKSVCPGLMSGSLSKLWKSHWLHQYSIMQNPSGFCFLDLSLSPAHYSVTFGKSVKCLRVICTIGKNRKPFPSHLTGSAGAKRWFGKDTAPPQFPSDPSHQSCLSHQGT